MNFLALNTSLKMFSIEHILAVIVTLLIIVVFYFSRNFFINNKKADTIFRISLGLLLIYSEFQIRFDSCFNKAPIVLRNIPIPLCGMLLWISAVALISNSTRIMKKFYPIFLTAASLSLIMCEIPDANFPQFRAFQYFICHGGFMLGALYFVFTRKINKFTFKDYGWSCLIIGLMGGIMSFLFATNRHVFPDAYMVMGFGMDIFRPVYDACGQIGYSLIYMGSIALFMFVFSLITYYITKKRDNKINEISYQENKFLDYITFKISVNGRKAIITILVTAFLYFSAWQAVMANMSLDGNQDPLLAHDPLIVGLGWFIGLLWFVILFAFVINEVAYYYNLQHKK